MAALIFLSVVKEGSGIPIDLMRKLYRSKFSPIRTYLHFKEMYSLNLVIVVYIEKKSVVACIPSGNFFLALSLGFYQEEIVVPNRVM